MDEKRLAEIKERAEKATSGPWCASKPRTASMSYINKGNYLGLNIASTYQFKDAEFIANARQDVVDLLVEIERFRKALEFYADDNLYEDNHIEEDRGTVAYKTLKNL